MMFCSIFLVSMWIEFSYIFHLGIFTNDKQTRSGWNSWVDYETTSKDTVFNSLKKNFTSKFLSLKSLTQMSWDVGTVVLHHSQCNFAKMWKVNKNCTQYPVTLRRWFFGVRMGFLKIFCATCGKSLNYLTHSIVNWSFRVKYLPICQITKFESLLKRTVSQI